jgi:hypothetical protein
MRFPCLVHNLVTKEEGIYGNESEASGTTELSSALTHSVVVYYRFVCILLDGRKILKWSFKKWDEGMDWIDLAQDGDRWHALVKVVMNPLVP